MNDDDDRRRILERRARYIAMALAGVGTATQAACGPCLSGGVDADLFRDASIDATTFEVCLSPLFDAPIADAPDALTGDAPTDLDAALEDDAGNEGDTNELDADPVDRDVGTPAEDAPDGVEADEDAP